MKEKKEFASGVLTRKAKDIASIEHEIGPPTAVTVLKDMLPIIPESLPDMDKPVEGNEIQREARKVEYHVRVQENKDVTHKVSLALPNEEHLKLLSLRREIEDLGYNDQKATIVRAALASVTVEQVIAALPGIREKDGRGKR